MWKRSFALLLSLVMVFGMVPVNAFAEETECSHSYETTVTDPTCTAVGYTTYTCACGDTYTADEVAATGHSYADGICSVCGAEEHTHSYEAVVTAPTCGEAGFTTYTCACGDTYTADEVAALGHSYADGVCGTCGAVEVKVCSVDENCEADTHEVECPMGPCTLTEGCSLAKGHVALGVPCDGRTTYESDSATVSSYDELVAALASGSVKTITLAADIDHLPAIIREVTIDGNGHKVAQHGNDRMFDDGTTYASGTVVLKNIVFTNGNEVIRTDISSYPDLTLELYNCTFNNLSNQAILAGSTGTGTFLKGLVVSGCTFNATNTSSSYMLYAQCVQNLKVENCVFNGNKVMRGAIHTGDSLTIATTATISGCTIKDVERGVVIPNRAENSSVTVSDMKISDASTAAVYLHDISTDNVKVELTSNEVTGSAPILYKGGTAEITKFENNIVNHQSATLNEDGTVTLAPIVGGTFNGGLVNMQNTEQTYLALESSYVYAEESVVFKIYDANGTLLATTSLINESLFGTLQNTLSTKVCITATSGSWETKWEEDKLRADYIPAYGVIYVDGIEGNQAAIQMRKTGTEESVNWADVPGVPGVPVAKIGNDKFDSLEKALDAAENGDIVELLWEEGRDAIAMNGTVSGKTVTITGTAQVDWSKGWLYIGRNGPGDGTLIFDNADLTSVSNSTAYGWNVSGRKKGTSDTYTGTVIMNNSDIELDYMVNKGSVTVNGGSLTLKNSFDVSGRPANETESGEDATATFTINGAAVTINNENGMGVGHEGKGILNINNGGSFTATETLTVKANGTVNVNGGSLTVGGTLNNNGVTNVSGESTLNIATNSGEEIKLCDGAIIKDSTVGGDVFVAGNVTFRGTNTFNMLYDFGTLTDNYGTTAPMKWTVESGASVILLNKARYGLGYGDSVTVTGNIQDAKTARSSLTEADRSLFMHGLVAQENPGWNCNSSFSANNAYLVIGSNNSFGNKPGNYGGKYTFTINNSVLDASRITFYEAVSTTNFSISNSDVKIGTFMTRDADSEFTLTNTTLLSTTTTNGTDEGNYNAGKLNLDNTSLTYSAPLTNTGTVVLKNGSKLTAPSLANNGTITVDASGYQTGDVVIELTNATPSKEMVTVTGAEGASVEVVENKLVIAVPVAKVGNDYYTTLKEAFENAPAGSTVTLMKDITVSENWDCRYTGTKLTKAITIDGAGHTMTFTGTVIDNNHFSVFRFEAPATVKNLNIDMSQCTNTGNMRAISTKADLVVENCDFTGNTTSNSRAIIFGEGSGAAIGEVDVKITGSTFTNWKRGLTDNENGQDVKSVEVTGNTFTNAAVYISAKEDLTFTGNTVSGAKVSITTYSKPAELDATATGNTLDAAQTNTIKAAVINAQPEFAAAVVAKIGSKTYGTLQAAVDAVQNGETIVVQTDITGAENVVVPDGVAFTLNLNDKTAECSILAPNANLTVQNGTIKNTNEKASAIEINAGKLTVTDVDIESARHALRIDGQVTATINSGSFKPTGAAATTTHGINVSGAANVTIKGGKFYGAANTVSDSGSAVNVQSGAKVAIKDGEFVGGTPATLMSAGELKLTGGTYDQNPGEFCEDRYAPAYDSAKGTWTVVEAAASVTGADNVPAYYPTVADAVKATDNGETLTIIADRKDPTKDTSVTKTAAMNIAANAQGGVTVTANVPANSKYVQIPVKGVTYRVGAYGDLTISKNGVVGGDNVPIKDGKPDYTLKPLNSEASYLSGSNATLTFESNMIFATFTKAYIDGTEIVLDKDYVATPGSTVITLANARMRTLTAGKHTLMIKDDSNNTVSCDFHVTVNASADTTNPKTGDSIFVPMFVMFSTAAALAVLVMGKKKYF